MYVQLPAIEGDGTSFYDLYKEMHGIIVVLAHTRIHVNKHGGRALSGPATELGEVLLK